MEVDKGTMQTTALFLDRFLKDSTSTLRACIETLVEALAEISTKLWVLGLRVLPPADSAAMHESSRAAVKELS